VALKGYKKNPTISSVKMPAELSGDIALDAYLRQDARNFVSSMLTQGNKTTSIRRRLNCLTAVFNYAYSEYDYSGNDPFSQVRIPKEGTDATKCIPFAVGELAELYQSAMTTGKRLRMAVPILGETGCRIAEVIRPTDMRHSRGLSFDKDCRPSCQTSQNSLFDKNTSAGRTGQSCHAVVGRKQRIRLLVH
jgi:site-specific recombinase XerD